MLAPRLRMPPAFTPQHFALPWTVTAHACAPSPVATAAVVPSPRPVTGTGTFDPIVVPLPSWPLSLAPQHVAAPSNVAAQTLNWLADNDATPEREPRDVEWQTFRS